MKELIKMINKRSFLVDVAKYQPASLKAYAQAGAKGAFIQVSVGTSIVAPNAHGQVKSAKYRGLAPYAYFYACFGSNAVQAKKEAEFAMACAKKAGIPEGAYFGVDWEQQDNYTSGPASLNTTAIIEAMTVLQRAGFKPLLYSSASLLRNKINIDSVIKRFGTCLWVASYATMGAINTPNFNYFPSMNGVAIWQFTNNWRGLNVDGNISLIDLDGKASHKLADKKDRPSIPSHGTFIINQTLKLHTSAHVSSVALATLHKGDAVKYDKTIIGPLRTWIRQPRGYGRYGYLCAVDRYGKLLGKVAK